MTREEVIQMALDSGLRAANSEEFVIEGDVFEFFERFAALVAAKKEAEFAKRLSEDAHSCGPDCRNVTCQAVREAVAHEREECAKVCESLKPTMRAYDHRFWDACHESAAAIRSRP